MDSVSLQPFSSNSPYFTRKTCASFIGLITLGIFSRVISPSDYSFTATALGAVSGAILGAAASSLFASKTETSLPQVHYLQPNRKEPWIEARTHAFLALYNVPKDELLQGKLPIKTLILYNNSLSSIPVEFYAFKDNPDFRIDLRDNPLNPIAEIEQTFGSKVQLNLSVEMGRAMDEFLEKYPICSKKELIGHGIKIKPEHRSFDLLKMIEALEPFPIGWIDFRELGVDCFLGLRDRRNKELVKSLLVKHAILTSSSS